jgi:hypothetical protein
MFGESCLQDGGSHQRQANVVAVGTVRCAKLLAEDAKSILGSLQAALDHAFTRKVLSSVEVTHTPLTGSSPCVACTRARTARERAEGTRVDAHADDAYAYAYA